MKKVKASELKIGNLFTINSNSELLGKIVGIELVGKESIIVKEQWFTQKSITKRQCSKDYIYYTQDSIFGYEDVPFGEYEQIIK